MHEVPDYLAICRKYANIPVEPVKKYETADDVIQTIYDGTFRGSCLLPVRPSYYNTFGQSVWVCANERQASRKRRTEKELCFTVEELKLVVETAMDGIEGLRCLIDAKRMFGGIIGVA